MNLTSVETVKMLGNVLASVFIGSCIIFLIIAVIFILGAIVKAIINELF